MALSVSKKSLFCILLFLACSAFTKANPLGNCTNKQDHLKECATLHLKTLELDTVVFQEEEAVEDFYKDPLKFVNNYELCNSTAAAADYMECSIKVFGRCATNTTSEEAHTSPSNARQAVEDFCEDLNAIVKKTNLTYFQKCITKLEPKVHSCEAKYVIDNDAVLEQDACVEHDAYTTCLATLDECSGETDIDLFSKWAERMTPQKCATCGLMGKMSTVTAALVVVLASFILMAAA